MNAKKNIMNHLPRREAPLINQRYEEKVETMIETWMNWLIEINPVSPFGPASNASLAECNRILLPLLSKFYKATE